MGASISPSSSRGYRPDIDGLRAIAVLSVMLFHADSDVFSGGYVGVDAFFVISGYLITSIIAADLERGRFTFRSFYERRVRRIMPALLALLLGSSVAATVLFMPHEFAQFGDSLVATVLFVSNMYFWQEAGYFAAAHELKPLLHTWSLAVEEQFYILFPIFFVSAYRWRGRAACVGGIGAVFAASLALAIWGAETHPLGTFYLAPTRAWELLLGSLLALGVVPSFRSRLAAETAALTGLCLIFWSAVVFDSATIFPGLNALVPCVGAGLLIHAGRSAPTLVGRLLSLRPLVFTGLISYSLYLWHWPALVFAQYYVIRPMTPAETATVLAASAVVAAVSWRLVETPFRKRTIAVGQRGLFVQAATVASVVLLLGLFAQASGGWPGRFEERTLAYARGADDRNPRGECHNRSLEKLNDSDLCRLGPDDGDAEFVLWGDSHADAIQPALEELALKHEVSGLHASWIGCAPLLNLPKEEGCTLFNEAMLKAVADAKPQVVFLAARWSNYPAEWLDRHLEETLRRISEHVAKLVVVAEVPRLLHSGPSAMAQLVAVGESPERYAVSTEMHARNQEGVMALFLPLKDELPLKLVDPADALCSGGYCRSAHAGRSLYYDDNHLSTYGARYVGKIFEPVFRELARWGGSDEFGGSVGTGRLCTV